MTRPSVLFVCLGNICRSPLAEAALRKAAQDAGLDVDIDSAGTADYHVGEPPDPRSVTEARRHGVDISGYSGRQLSPEDFHRFAWIVGMDRSNMDNLTRIQPREGSANVVMALDLVPGHEGRDVEDPWYGEQDGFKQTWHDVTLVAQSLVDKLKAADD